MRWHEALGNRRKAHQSSVFCKVVHSIRDDRLFVSECLMWENRWNTIRKHSVNELTTTRAASIHKTLERQIESFERVRGEMKLLSFAYVIMILYLMCSPIAVDRHGNRQWNREQNTDLFKLHSAFHFISTLCNKTKRIFSRIYI